MDAKHTPGPWSVSEDEDGNGVVAFSGTRRYWITGMINHAGASSDSDTAMANANLIAAAPELLALVIRYRNETPMGNQPHMIAHKADAVIAKATGIAS